MRRSLLLALALAALCPALYAQTGAASITGLVTRRRPAPRCPASRSPPPTRRPTSTTSAASNNAGNYTITPLPVGTYVVKAELTGFRTATTHADHARGEADRAARLQDGGRARSQETVEVVGPAPILQTETATVGEVISGNTVQSLPLNGRNTGQLALLLPGTMTYNPRGFTNIGSINMNRPFVNGNREQTNNFTVDGFDVNETIDNRVVVPAEPGRARRDQRRDQQLRGRHRQRRRRGDQQRHQVRHEQVPRQRVRVLPEQRLRREHLGEQPLERAASRSARSTSSAARSAVRSSRTSCSSSPTTRARGRTRPGFGTASVAPEAWRRGDLSSITTPIRDPLTGLPFPGNQIPLEPHQPDRRARS